MEPLSEILAIAVCQNFKTYQYLPFFLEKKPTLICKKNLPFLKITDQKPTSAKLYLGQTKIYIKITIQQFIWPQKIQTKNSKQ